MFRPVRVIFQSHSRTSTERFSFPYVVDGMLPHMIIGFTDMTSEMIVKLVAVVVVSPAFILPSIFILLCGAALGQLYMKAQLSVKREMSVAKAPVLGQYVISRVWTIFQEHILTTNNYCYSFGAAIAGLSMSFLTELISQSYHLHTSVASIRAYSAQERFKTVSMERINRYTRAGRTFYNLNRWIAVRMDVLGYLFASALAAYLVYGQAKRADTTGFSLNMAGKPLVNLCDGRQVC